MSATTTDLQKLTIKIEALLPRADGQRYTDTETLAALEVMLTPEQARYCLNLVLKAIGGPVGPAS